MSNIRKDPPSVLLAWNMTDRLNWGGRGMHVALYQILSRRFGDVRRLPGHYQTTEQYAGFKAPDAIARPLWRRRKAYRLARWYVAAESFLGGHTDYIRVDPAQSAKNIIRYKDDVKYLKVLHDAIRDCDKLVVDGNGDMIFREQPSRYLLANLAVIELASYLGKEVHYVNSIFSDCSLTGRNTELLNYCVQALRKCRSISFRDPTSVELAQELAPDLEVKLVPDSLFSWFTYLDGSHSALPENGDFIIPYTQEGQEFYGKLDFGKPYICLTGGARAAWTQQRAAERYCALTQELKRFNYEVYLVPTDGTDAFLYDVAHETDTRIVPAEVPILMGGAILANARLLVTGRYHPSIMAASGGTPCVFLGTDSHKTRSLQRLLNYDEVHAFPALPNSKDIERVVSQAEAFLSLGSNLRKKVRKAAMQRAKEAERVASMVE